MSTNRRSRLGAAMREKSTAAVAEDPQPDVDGAADQSGGVAAHDTGRSLSLAPAPVTEPDLPDDDRSTSGSPDPQTTGDGKVAVTPPAIDGPARAEEPRSTAPASPQTAQVVGRPVEQQVTAPDGPTARRATDMSHLLRVVESGRDQRRYVEELPHRNDKGTYVKLPVHLQDALALYCDRDHAPQGALITALVDAYFRDVGVLPALGEGHRPNERLLERLRRTDRSYDY